MTTSTPADPDPLEPLRARFAESCPPRTTVVDGMEGENAGLLDDLPPRRVSLTWVWPGRWLLTIEDAVRTVLDHAELDQLAAEVRRESGPRGGGVDGVGKGV